MTLHSSQMGRGDRRRRLLTEERTANSGLPAEDIGETPQRNGQSPARKSGNYGDAEFLQTQARLTDLIPRRLISYILLLKVGLAAIGGLMALYVWIPDLIGNPQHRPTMANLGSCGSLGDWFGSLLLLAAGVLAIIVYTIRRHKVDDYHGRYNVWLWAAACWFLMATGVAASLHQGLEQVMIAVTGTRIAGDGSIWWILPTVLIVGCIGLRLLIDMWSSRLSSAALILAAIAYLTALAATLYGNFLQSEVSELLLVQGALLGGHLLVAMSMGLHARYVVLDAAGALPKRLVKKKVEKKKVEKKAAEKKTGPATTGGAMAKDSAASGRSDLAGPDRGAKPSDDDDEESGDAWVAVDPPHGGSQPVLKRVSPSQTSGVPPLAQKMALARAESSAAGSASDESKLSKADRKALKRKKIEERMTREQHKASNW